MDRPTRRTLLGFGALAGLTSTAGCTTLIDLAADAATRQGEGGGSGAATGADVRRITYGETVEGRIDESDPRDPVRGSLAEPVAFEGSAGDVVSVRMRSDAVDPYVVVTGPGGEEVARNDDGGSGLNSQVTATLPRDGTYTIWAGSFSQRDTGSFRLDLSDETGGRSTAAGRDPGATAGTDLRQVSVGETADGYLDADDPRDPFRNSIAEPVAFEGTADQRVTVAMSSDPVDTYLHLAGPNGEEIAENDDANGLNSRLTATLPRNGTYTIWAGSFARDETGPYRLSVERNEPVETDVRRVAVGETIEGRIDESDPRDPFRNSLAEPVAFDGSAGDRVTISARSGPVDTYVVVAGPNGEQVAEDDDGGSGLNSQLTVSLSEPGTYTVWVGSFSQDDTGAYGLTLADAGSAPTGGDLRRITYGETAEGYIDRDDPESPFRGSLAEPVRFEAQAGEAVAVRARSDPVDTYLTLAGPNGEQVAEDDDGGDGLNSLLTTTVDRTGVYTVWVGSFGRDDTGRYRLTLSRR